MREAVAFALRYRSRRQTVPKGEIDRKVDAALGAMGLTRVADRHPVALSRGDRLRAVIAAILPLDPEIPAVDEPTTGQDWQGALAILDVLRDLNRRGKTVVLFTHHLYLLRGSVDRLVVMSEGGVRLDGPLRDVLCDVAGLAAAGLAPPQTVRLAQATPGLDRLRPMTAADIVAMTGAPDPAASLHPRERGVRAGMTPPLASDGSHRITPISAADLRVKVAVLVAVSPTIFVRKSLASQGAMFLGMLALLLGSGLGTRPIVRLAILMIPAAILILIIQDLWSPFRVTPVFVLPPAVPLMGGATVFHWEGLVFGLLVCCRLAVPLMAIQYLSSTSTPNQIVLGLVRVGVPYEVAFLVSTAFRIVPFLLEEYAAIRDAQRLRGIDLDAPGIVRKLVATSRLIVPLLVNCLNKAQQLQIALQARGFTGNADRTYLDPGRARMTGIGSAAVTLLFGGPAQAIVLRPGFGGGAEVL